MNIHHLYTLVFSPAGHTAKAADVLSDAWTQNPEKSGNSILKHTGIDLSQNDESFSLPAMGRTDLCIIAVPSFGGRVPVPAKEKLKQLQGDGTPVVLLVSYGARAFDDTFLELRDLVTEKCMITAAAVAVVAEHSICPEIAAGRPSEQDLDELREWGWKIREKLDKTENLLEIAVPGKRPYREFNPLSLTPVGGTECRKCGICAAHCPVNAISAETPETADPSRCITCMRCVWICPHHARHLPEAAYRACREKLLKVCDGKQANTLII